MTDLLINNEPVMLPGNFATQIIEGNPFINPIGETSLDVDISLLEPTNAFVLGYLQRPNSGAEIISLPCTLFIDAEVKYGKCIVLEFSDETAKLQLVFKNSIFSLSIDENRKLRDLDLGTAVIDKPNIVLNLSKTYPEVDFQLLPVFDPDMTMEVLTGIHLQDGDLLNRYTYSLNAGGTHLALVYGHDGNTVRTDGMFAPGEARIKLENYRPQPYLSAIIKKVITALGFIPGVNEIADHPIYKFLYIVNGALSLDYADMLPDWTVKHFIEQIQLWQNCRFIYNEITGVVDVIYNHSNAVDPVFTELNVLDEFTGTPEENDTILNRERNLEYNLPDTDIYRYSRINKDVETSFPHVSTSASSIEAFVTALKTNGNPAWFYHYETMKAIVKDGVPVFVDEYDMLQNNVHTESADESLDIVPAEMKLIKFYIRDRMNSSTISYIYFMAPVLRGTLYPLMNVNDEDLSLSIDSAVQDPSLVAKETSSGGVMQLALYAGNQQSVLRGQSIAATFDGMPESFTRSVSDVSPEGFIHEFIETAPEGKNPLSLQFLNEELYSKEADADTKRKYRYKFFHPGKKLNITDIFVIHNNYYLAYQFVRDVNSDGMNELIEGEFFKIQSLTNN